MHVSMTGFSSGQGEAEGLRWSWDLRSVNNKGLDIRARVPDWVDGLEQALKTAISQKVKRGSVTVSLRLQSAGSQESVALNSAQMTAVLDAMTQIEEEAMSRGLSLAPSTASDIVAIRGILDSQSAENDPAEIKKILLKDFETLLGDFIDMRQAEGAIVGAVLIDQLDQIDALIKAAINQVVDRKDEQSEKMRAAIQRVVENTDVVDESRLAQELALIAVKSDVTEELDRLQAHVVAARDLLAKDAPIGRKLDFLMQEFNREANTLCAKSQSAPLTRIGLDLKSVIDQLREQVQNLE